MRKNKSVLTDIKELFLQEKTTEAMIRLLDALCQAEVYVPVHLKPRNEEDQKKIEANRGKALETNPGIGFVPDILQSEGKNYLPVFTDPELAPPSYHDQCSWIRLPFVRAISMARSIANVGRIVLDAFDDPVEMEEDVFKVCDEIVKIQENPKEDDPISTIDATGKNVQI